jgi:protein-S-isoprenylcysteine O-methyltransferase Ste14
MLTVKKVRRWIDIVAYPLVVALAVRFGSRVTLWYVALGFSLASAALWALARWQLGDAFSVDPEARHLVTRGLYSRIRHPVYLFGDLAYLGALLALQLGWPLVVWLVVALVDIRRARREERVLAEAFGPEYMAYRSRTWF